MKLIPISYIIEGVKDISITAKSYSEDGSVKTWAVSYQGYVLNKTTGEYDYEPTPSNRSENFLQEHRFSSSEEAFECFKKYKK